MNEVTRCRHLRVGMHQRHDLKRHDAGIFASDCHFYRRWYHRPPERGPKLHSPRRQRPVAARGRCFQIALRSAKRFGTASRSAKRFEVLVALGCVPRPCDAYRYPQGAGQSSYLLCVCVWPPTSRLFASSFSCTSCGIVMHALCVVAMLLCARARLPWRCVRRYLVHDTHEQAHVP